jgi:hypothetical protein
MAGRTLDRHLTTAGRANGHCAATGLPTHLLELSMKRLLRAIERWHARRARDWPTHAAAVTTRRLR